MLTVRLSARDLELIRISVSPAFQTITAALMANPGEVPAVHAVRTRALSHTGPSGASLMTLLRLDGAHLPDFLSPAPTTDEAVLVDELELGASTPDWRRARDARHLEPFVGRSATADALVAGDGRTANRILEGVLAFHRATYGDGWDALRLRLRADADRKRRDLDDRGADYVLSTIHPSIRWRRPVLTISGTSYDGSYERQGQGVVLVPTIGRLLTVVTMINPWEPVTIGYPILSGPRPGPPGIPIGAKLVRLVGRTKARLLVAVACSPDLTTTELAAHVEISVPSASEHASVLRGAGLIASSRDRNAVRHTLLPLGAELIRSTTT